MRFAVQIVGHSLLGPDEARGTKVGLVWPSVWAWKDVLSPIFSRPRRFSSPGWFVAVEKGRS